MSKHRHHIALVPGLLGFAQLGGFDYFIHVEDALSQRFADAGRECDFILVSSPPSGSIVRRAHVLLESVERFCSEDQGPIHFIGHSTGGLDIRLLSSPTTQPALPAWFDRVRSATSICTPHYGTPLAEDFTSLAGTRLLYVLSLLTFETLRFGGPPITALTPLFTAFGKLDSALGLKISLLERTSDLLLRFLGEQGMSEISDWFDGIRGDRGAIIQLTPESMDIFNAAVEDNPAIRYGSVAVRMPPPGPIKFATRIRTPVAALSAAFFTTLYMGASRPSSVYPSPMPAPETQAYLEQRLGLPLAQNLNDGLVPTLSMLWGELLWAGSADHLDILGHFQGDKDLRHTDWQVSGADFHEPDFDEAMDAIADFLLDAS